MTTVDRVEVEVRAKLDTLQRDLQKMQGDFNRNFDAVKKSSAGVESSLKRLGVVAASAISVAGINSALKMADSYNTLQSRIKDATRATGDYATVSNELFAISQRTGTQLANNVELFQRISVGARDLGKSNTEVLKLSEAVQKLGVIGGSSTAAMSAGTTQFAQAMSAGIVRAEEFNSIIENIPAVANAIATGLGKSVGELRQMVIDGKLLSTDVFDALQSQAGDIEKRFSQMTLTMSRGWVIAENNLQKYLGGVDSATGATGAFAQGIVTLSENLDVLNDTIAVVSLMAGGSLVARMGAGAVAMIAAGGAATTLTAALRGTVALLGGPLGVALGTTAAAVYLLVQYTDSARYSAEKHEQALSDLRSIHEQLEGASKETRKGLMEEARLRFLDAEATLAQAEAMLALKDSTSTPRGTGLIGYQSESLASGYSVEELQGKVQKAKDKITELRNELHGVADAEVAISKNKPRPPLIDEKAEKNAKSLEKALRDLHQSITDEAAKQGMDEIEAGLYDYDRAVEKLVESYGKLNAQQELQVALGRETLESTLKNEKAMKEAEKAAEELKRRQEEYREMMQRPFDNALENVQREFGDTFTNIFENGIDGAEDFADNMKRIFFRLAGELTAMMVIRATLGGVDGGFGGMGGTSSLTGGASGSGGMGGLGNISSLMNGFSGLNSPIFNGSGFIGQSINKFGSMVGYGSGGIGPAMPLTNTLTAGTSLAGFGGNLAADFLLGDDRGVGASVGGAVGGIGGAIVGGPMGAAIGAFLGNAIGGLFGSSEPKDQISSFYTRLNTDLTAKNPEFGSDGMGTGAAEQLSSVVLDRLSGLDRMLGLDFDMQRIGAQYSMKNGTSLQYYSDDWQRGTGEGYFKNFEFDPEDAEETNQAFAKLTVEMLKNMDASQDLTTAMKNIQTEGRSAADIMADVNFAANFERLGEAEKPISALEQRFRELSATAERLGLSTDKVRRTLAEQFNDDMAKQIQAMLDPAAARAREINEYFDLMVEDAKLIGASVNRVEKLRDLTLENEGMMTGLRSKEAELTAELRAAVQEAQRLASQFDQMANSLKKTMDSQLFGANSALNVDDQLALLRERAFSLSGKTDMESLQEINSLVPLLTDISRKANATNSEFASDFDLGQALLKQAMNAASNQASYQSSLAARGNAALGNATPSGGSDINAAISQLSSIQSQIASQQAKLLELTQQNTANNYGRATG